jgi:hypothetical protein
LGSHKFCKPASCPYSVGMVPKRLLIETILRGTPSHGCQSVTQSIVSSVCFRPTSHVSNALPRPPVAQHLHVAPSGFLYPMPRPSCLPRQSERTQSAFSLSCVCVCVFNRRVGAGLHCAHICVMAVSRASSVGSVPVRAFCLTRLRGSRITRVSVRASSLTLECRVLHAVGPCCTHKFAIAVSSPSSVGIVPRRSFLSKFLRG